MRDPATVHARGDPSARMLDDVRAGLFAPQKELPPTYFYDARGSALFDEITRLPEYYLTRTEHDLLERNAEEIIARTQPHSLAELGAGMATKSRILLRALRAAGGSHYFPIDISATTLAETADVLRHEFPGLDVHPVVADMRDDVHIPSRAPRPLLYAFLGSTIGNFTPLAAQQLLARVRSTLHAGDHLLLGLDLRKDPVILEAAYNDTRGVTAEFNRNMLRVLNYELGATFDPDNFEHRAFYNKSLHQIEMHLVARRAHCVQIPGIGEIGFTAGETIRTEISCKYDQLSADALLSAARFQRDAWMTDAQEWFALVLARPV
jgi:L-histidine N-alpha-methyltransferase